VEAASTIRISIEDDGLGVGRACRLPVDWGWLGIQERLGALVGRVEVITSRGRPGFRLEATHSAERRGMSEPIRVLSGRRSPPLVRTGIRRVLETPTGSQTVVLERRRKGAEAIRLPSRVCIRTNPVLRSLAMPGRGRTRGAGRGFGRQFPGRLRILVLTMHAGRQEYVRPGHRKPARTVYLLKESAVQELSRRRR
jgi:hypothetical protein